jgi:hypothetical protein
MNPEDIVALSRSRFDHESARRVLKEKYQAKLVFAHAGGMWQAGPELQTTLLTCPEPEAVILDLYETPVKINVQDLMTKSQERWQEQMTAWLIEHQNLSRQR